jgi:hypothetical protein
VQARARTSAPGLGRAWACRKSGIRFPGVEPAAHRVRLAGPAHGAASFKQKILDFQRMDETGRGYFEIYSAFALNFRLILAIL